MNNFDINSHWRCLIENELQLKKLQLIFPLYFNKSRYRINECSLNHIYGYPCYIYNGYNFIQIMSINSLNQISDFKETDINLLLNYDSPILYP